MTRSGEVCMKPHALGLPVLVLLLAAADPPPDAVEKELAQLQGTWQLVSAVKDGKQMPEEQAKQIRVVIQGSKHTVYFGSDIVVKDVPFKIDPTRKPKAVDDLLADGQVVRGIYELDGDSLRSCVAAPGKERPTAFS